MGIKMINLFIWNIVVIISPLTDVAYGYLFIESHHRGGKTTVTQFKSDTREKRKRRISMHYFLGCVDCFILFDTYLKYVYKLVQNIYTFHKHIQYIRHYVLRTSITMK